VFPDYPWPAVWPDGYYTPTSTGDHVIEKHVCIADRARMRAIDRQGNVTFGYSFGGTPHFAGQRFAARLVTDPPGVLGFRESVLAEGAADQTTTLRWEDYTQTAMDPVDDCTIWYVGDYLKAGAQRYSTRIGAFRIQTCK
jgi:hypothetical protein